MTRLLLDTHAWAWSLADDPRLSRRACSAMVDADIVLISPISVFEIAQKVRLGKWPEMAPFADRLADLAAEQGATIASLEPAVALRAGLLDWSHRDPFDRLLAASALHYALPIVSADAIFDGIVTRIW